jgi:hypothetical protein
MFLQLWDTVMAAPEQGMLLNISVYIQSCFQCTSFAILTFDYHAPDQKGGCEYNRYRTMPASSRGGALVSTVTARACAANSEGGRALCK